MDLEELEIKITACLAGVWNCADEMSLHLDTLVKECMDFEKKNEEFKTTLDFLDLFLRARREAVSGLRALVADGVMARIERAKRVEEEKRRERKINSKKRRDKRVAKWRKNIEALDILDSQCDHFARRVIAEEKEEGCFGGYAERKKRVLKIIMSPEESGGVVLESSIVDKIVSLVIGGVHEIKRGE